MASTATVSPLLNSFTLRRVRNDRPASYQPHSLKSSPAKMMSGTATPGRRQLLFLFPATLAAVSVGDRPSVAADIPLFGIRKGLKKVEEEAEVIVKEGFEAADKGLETAERGIEAAERGIVTAEKEIETAVSFSGLAQAGAVGGAEVLGVLVATSIVNGILGPEPQNS
ncbi:uncharacterized protein LOC133812364 [Humulus lupulus]|uniref:uncharacterized protein LOC133812364 n=1 Tax=Humulus lupulus TaxID=3486 RepID=UPI002B40C8AB|nr:uncharacterized protein LOC133812364 [Humulus lupulus]